MCGPVCVEALPGSGFGASLWARPWQCRSVAREYLVQKTWVVETGPSGLQCVCGWRVALWGLGQTLHPVTAVPGKGAAIHTSWYHVGRAVCVTAFRGLLDIGSAWDWLWRVGLLQGDLGSG